MAQQQKLVAYAKEASQSEFSIHDDACQIEIWRPGLARILVPGLSYSDSLLLWLCNRCHVFRNPDYVVVLIRLDSRIVHRSCVIPSAWRWPFMEPDDLQISSTWTEPAYRNRGLATTALVYALGLLSRPGRRFWYFAREENTASLAVCAKAGFRQAGTLRRCDRFGFRLFSDFELEPIVIEQTSVPEWDTGGRSVSSGLEQLQLRLSRS